LLINKDKQVARK